MNRIKIILLSLCVLLPSMLLAQSYKDVDELVKAYSNKSDVEYTDANRAMIWMVKAAAPKGAMDGVKSLQILNFKQGSTSAVYKQFRSQAEAVFAATSMEQVEREETDKGYMEVFANPNSKVLEYMMFMFENDSAAVMLMRGEK